MIERLWGARRSAVLGTVLVGSVPMGSRVRLSVVLASLVWLACTSAREPDLRPDVIRSLATDFAGGTYAALDADAHTLAGAVDALCDAPTAATLEAARDAWWAARAPWKETEVVLFGPVVEYPERLLPKLDAWPADPAAIEGLVASDAGLSPADFAAMGSMTRGLPVVEYLLYAPGPDGATTLDALTSDPRRCAVLRGASQDVALNTGALHAAWRESWQEPLSAPSSLPADAPLGLSMYVTTQDVLNEWLNRMAFTLENVRSMKLGRPLGDSSGGVPMLQSLESRYSGRSLNDARDALVGVERVWSGNEAGALGLTALLGASPDLVARVDAAFAEAFRRLDAVPEPLEQSIMDDAAAIRSAQEGLLALQVLLQVDVAQALHVTITFNDNDGD